MSVIIVVNLPVKVNRTTNDCKNGSKSLTEVGTYSK